MSDSSSNGAKPNGNADRLWTVTVMERIKSKTKADAQEMRNRLNEHANVQTKIAQVYQERCSSAFQRYRDAMKAASEPLVDGTVVA
ncbi:MAG: hypothetical protein K0S56_2814 [Microvirga sp.]|nr:hypothetical protein [Microvirga sp.]